MNDKQFNSEFEYQIHMNIMRMMLKNELINENEYKKIDTILIEKYKPFFSSLNY